MFAPSLASAQETSYKPEVFGLVKARYEADTYSGQSRFSVRNTRLGVKGYASEHMRYAAQIELNNLGQLSVLDAYAGYGVGGFEILMGQQLYGLADDLSRGASGFFANRSFVSKYMTQYFMTDTDPLQADRLSTIGAREIGAMGRYVSKGDFPFSLQAGVFNGAGINSAAWQETLNVSAKATLGGAKGFSVSGSYYGGQSPFGNDLDIWCVEARYADDLLTVETAYTQRLLMYDGRNNAMSLALAQAMYIFTLPENRFARGLMPQLRYDWGENIGFINSASGVGKLDSFDGSRVTLGLCVLLTGKAVKSELRFNFEKYLVERTTDFASNNLLHDKFSVEFFVRF